MNKNDNKEKLTNKNPIINEESNNLSTNNNNIKQNETNKEESDETITHIKEILDSIIPYLNMDGGDVEFVAYKDKVVYVRLTGACQACLFSDDTIKNGLYETLHADIPEIEGVINTAI